MYITLNSQFKPFTYDELVKPLQDYGEAYREVEEQYATLAQQTEAWKNIATQENSPEAYAMYKKYSDELNAVVEDFSKGMTAGNRGKLLGLKTRYASEIGAIEQAHKAYNDMLNFRNNNTDKSAIYLKNYSSMDDFLDGKIADNNYISGDQVQKDITSKVLAQAYSDYSNLVNSGVKPDKAVQIIVSGNNQSIADIIAGEKSSLGIESFDTQGQAKLNNAILSGVQQGLGSFASKEYMSKAERDASARGWANLAESRKQHARDLEMHGYNKDGSININSPYWSMQGIKWTYSKDGTLIPEVETKPGTGDKGSNGTKRGFIISEKRSFNLDGEIQASGDSVDLAGSTQVNYSDLNTTEKSIVDKQIGEDGDISAFEFYVIRNKRDAKKRVIIVPKKSIILNNDDSGDNDW